MSEPVLDPEKEALRATCTRFLNHHRPERMSPVAWFRDLAERSEASARPDHYGEGPVVESFEREVATLLGKEAALFFPSGTMTQQIALRIWTDRINVPRVAFHL